MDVKETEVSEGRLSPGGVGVLPYKSYIGMCRPKGCVFLAVGLKTGINFDHYGLKSEKERERDVFLNVGVFLWLMESILVYL